MGLRRPSPTLVPSVSRREYPTGTLSRSSLASVTKLTGIGSAMLGSPHASRIASSLRSQTGLRRGTSLTRSGLNRMGSTLKASVPSRAGRSPTTKASRSDEPKKWWIHERYASLYPSTRSCGVALWVFVDGTLAAVAAGSVPLAGLPALLRRYRPRAVLLESQRRRGRRAAPVPIDGTDRIWWAYPGWEDNRPNMPPALRNISPLGRAAFALGFRTLFRRPRLRLGSRLPAS